MTSLRVFLVVISILLFAPILSGCQQDETQIASTIITTKILAPTFIPTLTPTREPTHTSTLTPSPIPTETPIPTLQGFSFPVPDPFFSNPDIFDTSDGKSPVYQLADAMSSSGLEITDEDVIDQISFQELIDINGDAFAVAVYKFDPDSLQEGEILEGDVPLAVYSQNGNWEEATIRNLSDKIHVLIGTTASFGDKNAQGETYQYILENEFGLVSILGAFANRWIDQYNNPDYWTNVAAKNNQLMKVKAMYFHHDFQYLFKDINNQDDLITAVNKHFQTRSRRILSYIDKYDMRGRAIIELANEPFEDLIWVPIHKSPIQKAYGNDWITEAYINLYETAINEFNMVPGEDFIIIGVNERDIEIPGAQSAFVIGEVNKIKRDIANRLNIPEEELPFELGIEYHLGEKHGARDAALPLSYLTHEYRQYIIEHLQNISNQTNSRIHFTEIDAIGEESDVARGYAELIQIAEESDVVDTFVFFQTLASDRLEPSSDWQNPLFKEKFDKGKVYYSLISRMLQILQ